MFGYNHTKMRGGEAHFTRRPTLLTSTTMVTANNKGSQVINNN
jgi:hypothetical protein